MRKADLRKVWSSAKRKQDRQFQEQIRELMRREKVEAQTVRMAQLVKEGQR